MAVDKKGLTFDKRVEHHKFAKTQSPAVSSRYQLPGTSILGAYLDKEIILPLFFFMARRTKEEEGRSHLLPFSPSKSSGGQILAPLHIGLLPVAKALGPGEGRDNDKDDTMVLCGRAVTAWVAAPAPAPRGAGPGARWSPALALPRAHLV